jgi:hypothetical protein
VDLQKSRQAINVKSGNVFGLEPNKEPKRRGIGITEAMSLIQESLKLCRQEFNGGIILEDS